jgi:hypothetical protein
MGYNTKIITQKAIFVTQYKKRQHNRDFNTKKRKQTIVTQNFLFSFFFNF